MTSFCSRCLILASVQVLFSSHAAAQSKRSTTLAASGSHTAQVTMNLNGTASLGSRFSWLAMPGGVLIAIDRNAGTLRVFEKAGAAIVESGPVVLPSAAVVLVSRNDSLIMTEHISGTAWSISLLRLLSASRKGRASHLDFASTKAPSLPDGYISWSSTQHGWLALLGLPMSDAVDPELALPILRVTRRGASVQRDTSAFFRPGTWLLRVDDRTSIPYQPLNDGDLLVLAPSGDRFLVVRRVTAVPKTFRVVVFTALGKDSVAVSLSSQQVRTDEQTIADARQDLRDRLVGAPIAPSVVERALHYSLYIPRQLPAVREAMMGHNDFVYLTTSLRPRTLVTVLAPSLEHMADFSFAANERLLTASGSELWSLQVTTGDSVTMRVYDVRQLLDLDKR